MEYDLGLEFVVGVGGVGAARNDGCGVDDALCEVKKWVWSGFDGVS